MSVINFPYKELNGILRYFYKKDKSYYKTYLDYKSSGDITVDGVLYKTEYAFDFDESLYWLSGASSGHFLSFCFKAGFAIISGYEIKTSNGNATPTEWAFSASNDNSTWEGRKEVKFAVGKGETHYEKWSAGPFRCYKIEPINSAFNVYKQFDLAQIEIYGKFFKNSNGCTCKASKNVNSNMPYMIILLLCNIK